MRHATGLLCLGLATAVLWPAAPAYADGIRDQQWYLGALNVTDAQARSRGQGMVVAVIDTGVDGSHQDLAASLLPPVTVDGSTDTGRFDPDGHGTGLAGLISAQGHGANREHGVVGIAPGAKVLPVVFRAGARPDETGRAVGADQLAAGIDLAVRRGAKVICVGYSVDGMLHVYAAVDCGDVINVDSATAQVEGGIVFGLSAALLGEITIEGGKVVQRNFRDHEMIHIADAPQVTAAFVRSDAPLGGLGEPCVPPVAAAVTNAIYAATGVRIRTLPIGKQKLRV
jgi:subtilisin family serine protease